MFYFFSGVLFFQIIYVLTQWGKHRLPEYIYYCLYLVLVIFYFFILEIQHQTITVPSFFNDVGLFLNRPVVLVLFIFYVLFAQHFIEIKKNSPSLNRLVNIIKLITVLLIAVSLPLYFVHDLPIYTWLIIGGNIVLMILSLYVIFRLQWKTNKLAGFVLRGSLCALTGTVITNFFDSIYFLSHGRYALTHALAILPSQVGILLETYFFMSGLTYKAFLAEKEIINMQQKLIEQLNENEKLLIEKQLIRNKIARDLHDDIGATLSGIALQTNMVKQQVVENKTTSILQSLNVIETGAQEMVNNLDDVVWTVNPKNDNVLQFIERLKEYAYGMTQAKNIRIEWKVDPGIGDAKLPMEYRRNIYLICKEAVNNAVKYSGCSEIMIGGEQENNYFIFSVCDNGKGFDSGKDYSGNGLKNMRNRAQENKMELQMESGAGKGTTIRISCLITQ